MPLPKLSPLQSRLAASLVASFMLLILYLFFSSAHFAYAADVDSIRPEDHNHNRLQTSILDVEIEELELEGDGYEADFIGYDRGIIGRAATSDDPSPLLNNRPVLINVPQGTTLAYMFSNDSLWNSPASVIGKVLPSSIRRRKLEQSEGEYGTTYYDELDGELKLARRQDSSSENRTLYVTANVCLQPDPQDTSAGPAPQMMLYISQSANNTNPGPSQDSSLQQMLTLDGGWGMMNISATGNVYIGLSAPNTTSYTGPYSVSIAASIDEPYHYYNEEEANLHLVDSDAESGLFITDNLTLQDANSTVYQEWMSMSPPFVMFANNQSATTISGVEKSYCGLKNYAQAPAAGDTETGMTTSGLGNHPKQQFYIKGLTRGSSYYGYMTLPENTTTSTGVVGGGGEVWRSMSFTTLSDNNCAVIYNLSFCDQSEYAVPGNPNTFPDVTALAAFYDNATQAKYEFFKKVLAQIPCETTSSAQYSLAKTCDDCASDYKNWLCSVMIPRCTDFSSSLTWLQERNMVQAFPNGTVLPQDVLSSVSQVLFLNSSRNPDIDSTVQPGPYKEVLPCNDLCYDIVQSCPASMGFSCPMFGQLGFNASYGQRPDGSPEQAGQITCNYPGAAYFLAATGTRGTAPTVLVFIMAAILSLMFI